MIVLLDSGPLGMASHPKAVGETLEAQKWLDALLSKGHTVVIPEVVDYEVRRELIRARKIPGLRRLDWLKENVADYLPLSTPMMLKAAEFWAQARNEGRPNAADLALDADVILAAQAWHLSQAEPSVVIATTNPKHLSRFVAAEEWSKIEA